MNDELDRLLKQSHDGITVFDFEGKDVPCITLDEKRYDQIISKVAGRSLAIDTDLNILQDGLGHVFVEVSLKFATVGITEKVLVNANKDLPFFESLAKTSMISLTSPESLYGQDNVFLIQLPRPDKAEDALGIIKKGLAPTTQADGAVTGI